jgi:GT2 family glycosyltransferase/SAM-dependent methyltransferase
MIQFSVIVPTRNRSSQLRDCIAALERQNFPRDQFEVIVVDDGSEPPLTVEPGIRLVRQSHDGPAVARNTGAAHARGRWLAFTDDDCLPDANWLTVLAAQLAARPDHLLGGAVVNILTDNPYTAASQQLVSYLYSYYNADPSQPRFFTSNNMAVAAAAFRDAGGFDAELPRAAAEDRELCDRWLHQRRPMTFVLEAVVRHAHPLTLRTFWRQHFNYGCGAHYYHLTRAQRGGGPLRVEPWRFYVDLLRYPFTTAVPLPLRQAALLFVAQAANALGYLKEHLQGKPKRDATKYWEQVGTEWRQSQPDKLWRAHSDAVNRAWLAAWWPQRSIKRVLKTDMFDEAVGEGVFGLLKSRARFAVGMDIALATRPGVGADVRQLPFADGVFDVIVSNSTLDHFETEAELVASLRELRRVLRPGGELLLTLDNAANPLVAIRNVLPFTLLKRLGLTPYQVGVTCGPSRLRRLLRETGFEAGEMSALLHCPRVFAVKRARAVQRSGDTMRREQFLAGLMKWERLACWPTRWLTGYFVAAKAIRKP